MVSVKIDEKAGKMIITADLETPTPSASGKTLVVASTRGNLKTGIKYKGGELTIGLNAYIPKGGAAGVNLPTE